MVLNDSDLVDLKRPGLSQEKSLWGKRCHLSLMTILYVAIATEMMGFNGSLIRVVRKQVLLYSQHKTASNLLNAYVYVVLLEPVSSNHPS